MTQFWMICQQFFILLNEYTHSLLFAAFNVLVFLCGLGKFFFHFRCVVNVGIPVR